MAIQILNETSPGASIGAALGTGLGQALSGLAEHKVGQLKQRHLSQAFQGLGYDERQARALAELPEPLQKEVLKGKFNAKVGANSNQQKQIDYYNKPYVDRVESEQQTADEGLALTDRILNNLNTGKVASGAAGYASQFLPAFLQSDETQQFNADTTALALLLAQKGGARGSDLSRKLTQASKANTAQSRKTQENLIKEANELFQTQKQRKNVILELREKFGGVDPANLEKISQDILDGRKKSDDKILSKEAPAESSSNKIEKLTSSNAKELKGKRVRNTTDGKIYRSDGTKWIKEQ